MLKFQELGKGMLVVAFFFFFVCKPMRECAYVHVH